MRQLMMVLLVAVLLGLNLIVTATPPGDEILLEAHVTAWEIPTWLFVFMGLGPIVVCLAIIAVIVWAVRRKQ